MTDTGPTDFHMPMEPSDVKRIYSQEKTKKAPFGSIPRQDYCPLSVAYSNGEHQLTIRVTIIVFYLISIFGAKLAEEATRSPAPVRSALLELSHVNHARETENDLTDAQVDHIVKVVNRFRAIIHNDNFRFKRAAWNKTNYRKVRYSSVFEAEAKFECDDILGPEDFKSDRYTWRKVKKTANSHDGYSFDWDPRIQERLIDPFNHSIMHAAEEADTLRMALSPDVTEIGCFEKTCNGYMYIACQTGQPIEEDIPLYTPDKRCETDADCTLPGYPRCDPAFGLCDLDPSDKKVVSPLVCMSLTSPRMPLVKEKCDGVDTGSAIGEMERLSIVNSINEYRAMINNNCKLGLGIPNPASNYRKVKYNYAFESELTFECSSNLRPEIFISDEKIWRSTHRKIDNINRHALFYNGSPKARELLINPGTATVDDDSGKTVFMKLFMSEDVTEVGCYVKVCGDHEYIACKTNNNHTLPYDAPLYTPGQRCNSDADCTRPGYTVCDANVGLCDFKSHIARKRETYNKCADSRSVYIERVRETCKPGGYNTGSHISNLERKVYAYIVNRFRSLINNRCDLGRGNVQPISNYRKVEYSCALERDAKFDCPTYNSEEFKSDNVTLRVFGEIQSSLRKADFLYWSPHNHDMLLDPYDQTIGGNERTRSYVNFMMSPDVTEFGCFIKVCGDYEYMACKTGHVVLAPKENRLYIPGKRCTADKDCTLPDYAICDVASGLCDRSTEKKIRLRKPTVSPLICYFLTSPRVPPLLKENCNGTLATGSELSQVERDTIVKSINKYRAMINNDCTFGLGIPKPASNYRKVKYSCTLEVKSKFECSQNRTPESDEHTWRSFGETQDPIYRQAIFQRWSPWPKQLFIHTRTATIVNHDDKAVFMKLFLSEDVTEVGCFVKVCGGHEYIACKTNHDNSLPKNAPLYTPGERCNEDDDCTHPGYTTCDATVGMCDYKSKDERDVDASASKCDDVPNIYIDDVQENCNPGGHYTESELSNRERDIIVHTVNHFRALVNNECDLGKGAVKPVTNYRKVKYSCALELAVKNSFSPPRNLLELSYFKSDRNELRYVRRVSNGNRTAIFVAGAPRTQDMMSDPDKQTSDANDEIRSYIRFMMSPDVTEIGCFVKTTNGYESMVCTTGVVVKAPKERPLYAPGNRCLFDHECTLPGYKLCDTDSGLCDNEPRVKRISVGRHNFSQCQDIPQVYVERVTEKCSPHYDTLNDMSIKEREAIVNVANQFRALINNKCNLGLGNVVPYTNYRKLKYSCRYEEDARLECDNPNLATFRTDDWNWRLKAKLGTNRTRPLFLKGTPRNQDLLIEPLYKFIKSSEDITYFLRLVLDPAATEIGCFTKVCNGTEYYACKSGHEIRGKNYLSRTSYGTPCANDGECTLPSYGICDIENGMCEAS